MAEELQLSLETKLYEISEGKLGDVATYLKIEGIEGKSRIFIIRKIRQEVEKALAVLEGREADNQEIIQYLRDVLAFVTGKPPPLEESVSEDPDEDGADEEENFSEAKREYEEMQAEFVELLSLQEKKLQAAKERFEVLSQTTGKKSPSQSRLQSKPEIKFAQPSNEVVTTNQLFRFKDLKIQGTISNEKNRISYTSLNKQIESAIDKGYSEREIVDAIINAVSPSLHIRSYLESIKNLGLTELRKILRSHYCEKSASEAYQELTNIVQEASESPLTFLMRALKLRQHILLASQESGSKIRYDQSLVQSVFLNAVETGLADDAIRNRIRPFLQMSNVADELLIREINTATTTESERSTKLGTRKRVTKSSQVSVATALEASELPPQKPKEVKSAKQSNLLESLEAVKADVAMIKEAINAKQENKSAPRKSVRPPSACEDCITKNSSDRCDHCFICGSNEHFARGCRKRKQKQGNRGRLHLRDGV